MSEAAATAASLVGQVSYFGQPSQLSRLPQCLRTDKGRWQKLLYLDPEPDGVPIIQKPLRESEEAILKRLENTCYFLAEVGEQFPETILSEGGYNGK